MTSEECIYIVKNRLISLIDNGQLKATYNQSDDTISFYVNDISVGNRPLLTLRISDHRPTYQNYIQSDLTPPSSGINTNVSIEFYKPKYKEDGNLVRDKVNNGVKVPPNIDAVVPFIINSYKYTPKLLEKADVEEIYNAILNWINGGLNAKYIDPFANTYKKAIIQTKIANIKWNISQNISVDNDGNYVSANGDGADYVSETRDIYNKNKQINCNRNMKQTIRLTESELRGMIGEAVNEAVAYRTKRFNEGKRNNAVKLTESQLRNFINAAVNEALNEIGDTERGQYALGAVQARADMRARNAAKTGNRDEYQRYSNISGNANKTSFKHNYIGDMDDNYDSRKDLYNANQRGYKNYASYMNGAGNADYRTAPQTRKDVGY